MKLTDSEKRQLKLGLGQIQFSIDIGTYSYPVHVALQKKLLKANVRCNDTIGGTAIWPKNLWQLRRAKEICKDMGIELNKGKTFRESYQYERDIK